MNVSGIGDFVDSTLAIRVLRSRAPHARLTLLVAEKARPLAERCPYVDEVLALPTHRARNLPALRDLPRWLGAVRGLRGRFDLTISLYEASSVPGAWWMRSLLGWIGAPLSVGRNTAGRAPFFTMPVPDDGRPRDSMERMLEVVGTVGRDPGGARPPLRPELWIRPEEVAEARAFLGSHDWGDLAGPLVLAAFGGERPTRQLPPAAIETTLSALQREFGIRPVLWGRLSDPGLDTPSGIRRLDTRGQFDLVRSAALLSCADILITTHSAPQHLAGVWDIPTIVLVGPGDGIKYRPHVSPGRMVMLKNPVPCAPCWHWSCPKQGPDHQRCLVGIGVDQISDAFKRLSVPRAGG